MPVALAFAVALAGSLWALFGSGGCYSCSEAGRTVGRLPLAALGIAYYSALLALSLMPRRTATWRVVLSGALVAAGVHGALLSILVSNHFSCSPCLLTALGAFAAAVFALVEDHRPRVLAAALMIVPAAALLSYGIARLSFHAMMVRDLSEARKAAALVRATEPPVAPGRVRMVYFTQPNCHYCEELKQNALPALRKSFGPALQTEERPAWPGLPTPTIVLLGKDGAIFGGLPPTDDLVRAIRHARGDPATDVPPTGLAL